ncbi:hypothetical protein DAEQUDRAFT_810402 [Daedalea quercina L-15889]|uniref:F-box domain-containing protein n=1 Tax=Daedalea quercina L-15889 TaxID=1314783 RepID=A0A165RIX9_9APHY|nr:hypothetical protein DAEQUDRAFT_810402 [Daedalea quercina L-15889]
MLAVLPTEILVEILHLLDVTHRAVCRVVCKRFDYIVCHNARLRYPIDLALANCVDDHPEHPARVGTRLKLLSAHQDAWRNQDFRQRLQLVAAGLRQGCTLTASAYRNGTLVFGHFNAAFYPGAEPQTIESLRATNINEVHVFFLRHAGPRNQLCHREHIIHDADFSGIELEPSEDLLVLWDSHASNEWARWGPDASFVLGDVQSDDDVWSYALYGYRLMLGATLFDFDPRAIHSGRPGVPPGGPVTEGTAMELRGGTSFRDSRKWFAQAVETHRPYLRAPVQRRPLASWWTRTCSRSRYEAVWFGVCAVTVLGSPPPIGSMIRTRRTAA